MKKTIAILLACIMLIASVPFTVSAADQITEAKTINAGETLEIRTNVTVSANLVNNGEIIIYNGGSLTVINGGNLDNHGNIEVKSGGKLTAVDSGVITHYVTVPKSFSINYLWQETWSRQDITVDFDVYYYQYKMGDTDDAYAKIDNYKNKIIEDTPVPVTHGQKLFVMIVPRLGPTGDGNWVAAERLKLNAGSASLDPTTILDTGERAGDEHRTTMEYGAVFTVTPSNSCKISLASTAYKDIVKIYDIALPRTEGYYVITDNNDVDNVKVEFGKTLSFRVVLEPDYDKSDLYVYVNSIYMEPADFGYYRVSGPMTAEGFAENAGGVQDHLVITVMGVTSNESQEQMSSLLLMLQEIFSIIQEIFSYFMSLFEGLGSLGG